MYPVTETTTEAPARNYVGGEWRQSVSGETYEKRNPWRPSLVTGVFVASGSDARLGVEAAHDAAPAWASLAAAARGVPAPGGGRDRGARRAHRARHDGGDGQAAARIRLEAARAATILRYAAGEAWRPVGELYEPSVPDQRLYTLRRPVGVVGLITPWNFPIAIPVWKLAPALAYGNVVVLKLAYEAPRTGIHVAECFAEAGLPPGVLNVLTGAGSTAGAGSFVTRSSARSPSRDPSRSVTPCGGRRRPAAAVFSSSSAATTRSSWRLTPSSSVRSRSRVRGGVLVRGPCTATRRIFVLDDVYDEFRDRLLARVEAGRVGDPADPDVEVGPIVAERAMDEILAAIDRARAEGVLLAGGGRADDGLLIAPTIFEGLGDEAELSCEEVFGPVTSLYRVSTLDEAIARANAVRSASRRRCSREIWRQCGGSWT